MSLQYLVFDYSEDTEEVGVFDAMASTGAPQVAAVQAEIAQILDWAHATFPGQRGPVEEGGAWDYDLHGVQEVSTPQAIDYDARRRCFEVRPGTAGPPRCSVTLSVSGTAAFCEAFRAAWGDSVG